MSTEPAAIHPRTAPGRSGRAFLGLGVLLLMAILIALAIDRIFFHNSSGGAGRGSGIAATETRPVPPFTGVVLTGANNVIVHVGAERSVVVHADSNLLKRVTTQVRSGSLRIGTTPGNLSAITPMFVTVSVPSLDRLSLQGAGNLAVTGIDGQSLTVRLPGSGNVDAAGTVTQLDVTISGEGTARLQQLIARDANAGLSGDGTIMVTSTRSLSATVSGTGSVLYGGNPAHVSQKVTGSGTISPG